MALSDQNIFTCIQYGHNEIYTRNLSETSTIDDIHQEVRRLYGSHLRCTYLLKVYNPNINNFIKLNQSQSNEFDNGFNPFRLNSSIQNVVHNVRLYVVDATNEVDHNDTQSGAVCSEPSIPSAADLPTAMIPETESEQDLPVNNMVIGIKDRHDEATLNTLISNESNDTNICSIPVLTNNDTSDVDEFFTLLSNENPSDINLSDGDIDPYITECLAAIDAYQNTSTQSIDDNSSPPISIGDATPPHNNLPVSTPHTNTPQISVVEQNSASVRLRFSLDTKPEQKDAYLSDQINQSDNTKTNGQIPRVQGIKTPEQKALSVLPKVRIPKSFFNKSDVQLLVFVVLEILRNGKRVWIKDPNKNFLPINFPRDISNVNPIVFDFNRGGLMTNGDFKLKLRMVTLWDKTHPTEEIVYELDERSTIRLHSAAHDPSSPRLLCVLQQNNQYLWETFCLSDFIRSKKPSKRRLVASNSTGTMLNVSSCKRARAK